jgi:hypothetical protein
MGQSTSKEATSKEEERLKGPFSDHEFAAISAAFKTRAGKDGRLPQDAFEAIFQLQSDPTFATRLYSRFRSIRLDDAEGLELRSFVEGGKDSSINYLLFFFSFANSLLTTFQSNTARPVAQLLGI